MKSYEDRRFKERFANVEMPFGVLNMFDTLMNQERGFMLVFQHKTRKLRLGAWNAFTINQVFSFSGKEKFMGHFIVRRQYYETE